MFRAPSRWANRRNGWRLANRQVPVDADVPNDVIAGIEPIPEEPAVICYNGPPGLDMMDEGPTEDATSSSDVSSTSSDNDENNSGSSETDEGDHMEIDDLNNNDESGSNFKLHYII